ncbi:elongator complex protein 4 isoform X2 [Canis lupus familiaris]|uniref:Elongator complex protein 4 n=3 Tax=Canis lupus TaxID=9612 RepID=A0A8P0SXG6_CANLF|nr:elongator complex protein 4 isoform X2 [Canis lupus dingo]XP_038280121.1 elongator complex protein 4 isoform X2 [Canis lupus familiaris]XP_038419049.1 elongator complex protein 4 isoform X2 [Canis lupus familiaris]XP_540560.3 elongator complex protein 4 isoform X2 [Canis lupus familiaris]
MAAAATCGTSAGNKGCTAAAAAAAGGKNNVTSFQRKGPRASVPDSGCARLVSIAGTRPSVRNGQLLVSTGLPALDQLLGGGLAVGTVLLIEEDKYNIYSSLLFKYFLAEGVINGHTLLVASAKEDPADILQELPAPLLDDNCKKDFDEDVGNHKTPESNIKMKIAWRYQLLPKMEPGPVSSSRFGHYYDLSKRMPQELIETSKWHGFFFPEKLSPTLNIEPCSLTHGYIKLLQFIQNVIYEEGFDGSNPQKKQKNILRIGIQNLGSPLWGDDICCTENCDNSHSLTKFLYVLRGLLRTSLSACIITMPTHLIQNKAIIARVTNLSDTVVGLESFIGSERETNPLYKDYHGLIHIRQIPRLNNLIYDVSDVKDLAFKLKRKLFTIERLHLPPDLSDTVSRSSKQIPAASSRLLGQECGVMAGGRKHLDF